MEFLGNLVLLHAEDPLGACMLHPQLVEPKMGTINHLASHRRLPFLERVHGQLNAPGAVRALLAKTWFWLIIALLCFGVLVKLNDPAVSGESAAEVGGRRRLTAAVSEPILVSYSYFEKDAIQRENLRYFIAMGLGGSKVNDSPRNTDFVFVVSGGICTPCNAILPGFKADWRVQYMPELTHVYTTNGVFLLYRKENEGMDFAAHNVRSQFLLLVIEVSVATAGHTHCL